MPLLTRKQVQGIGVSVAERLRAATRESRYEEVTAQKNQAGDEKYSN